MKEMFENELQAKNVSMITKRADELNIDENIDINFESVDTIVLTHLQSIDSNIIDKQHLIKIYQGI